MRNVQSIPKLTIVLAILLIITTIALFSKITPVFPTELSSSPGIALRPPAFVKSARAASIGPVDFSFILEEAGVTAYTKVEQQLDLQFLPTSFKHIRQQTDDFILGIVYAPGYAALPEFDEKGEVQVLVHKDGWIVAYLTRWQTAAELFDWVNYDRERLTATLIESTIKFLATELELSNINISYYDFRYPEATDLILVADRADGITRTDSFKINIPREIQIYERVWSAGQFSLAVSGYNRYPGTCKLDDVQLISLNPPVGKWRLYLGGLNENNFSQGKDHTITVGGSGRRAYCGVSIVYGEAAQ
ncbi:hypothetical protein KFU94_36550 [Chloroflexi bacterium TSY]|nr:hypothetical protein [Chloroflexi bacterium TSY]